MITWSAKIMCEYRNGYLNVPCGETETATLQLSYERSEDGGPDNNSIVEVHSLPQNWTQNEYGDICCPKHKR